MANLTPGFNRSGFGRLGAGEPSSLSCRGRLATDDCVGLSVPPTGFDKLTILGFRGSTGVDVMLAPSTGLLSAVVSGGVGRGVPVSWVLILMDGARGNAGGNGRSGSAAI